MRQSLVALHLGWKRRFHVPCALSISWSIQAHECFIISPKEHSLIIGYTERDVSTCGGMISILHQTKNIISPASISKVLSSLRHEICKLTACQHNRRTTIEVDLQGRSFVATCATNIYHVFLLGKGTFRLLFEYSWPDKKKLRLQRMGIWKDVLPMHDQLFGSFLVRKKTEINQHFLHQSTSIGRETSETQPTLP